MNPRKRCLAKDSDDSGSDDAAEVKRQKRMMRNRESAATSRERKKAHIEDLEHQVAELRATSARLQSENDALRACVQSSDPSCLTDFLLEPTGCPSLADSAESLLPFLATACDEDGLWEEVGADSPHFLRAG